MKNHTLHRSVSPVEQPFTQNCPYCNAPIQEVGKDYIKRIGNPPSILSEYPFPLVSEHRQVGSFEEIFCITCNKTYLFLVFKSLRDKVDDATKERIFQNYVVNENQRKWVISRLETRKQIFLDSIFGPYPKIGSIFKNENADFRTQFDFKPEYDLLSIAGSSLFLDPAQPGAQT